MSTLAGHGADKDAAADDWTIVVPVKALGRAKSRLAAVVSASLRRALVLAMATDVLSACTAASGVSRVLVVTSDPEVAALANRMGLETVSDPSVPTDPDVDPLNSALTAGLDGVHGPVGVVAADLPELRPDALERVLSHASRHDHSTVPDHRGAGTTMAFWTGPSDSRIPRFGSGSAARYQTEGGAVPLTAADPSGAVGRDVDTPEDLAALSARPVGPATGATLRMYSSSLSTPLPGVCATMVP